MAIKANPENNIILMIDTVELEEVKEICKKMVLEKVTGEVTNRSTRRKERLIQLKKKDYILHRKDRLTRKTIMKTKNQDNTILIRISHIDNLNSIMTENQEENIENQDSTENLKIKIGELTMIKNINIKKKKDTTIREENIIIMNIMKVKKLKKEQK